VVSRWGYADSQQPELEDGGMKKQMDKADKLRGVFKGVKVKAALAKDAVVIFRATKAEKSDMQKTARALSMSLTEYLGRLHTLAKENMR
jgi:hypothetical protein